MERASDPEFLAVIRKRFGSRAQTLINILLAFDSYFNWYYPFKQSCPFLCDAAQKLTRAYENCVTGIDMQEMFERISICNHGSFLCHGVVYKVTRDILRLGDVHAACVSALELHNAEAKRTASTGGSRRTALSSTGTARKPMRGTCEGPARLVETTGYRSTMALSTMNKLLGVQYLRQGGGIASVPQTRKKERLFGAHGTGRSSLACVKVENYGYKPKDDSCIGAFIRELLLPENQ
jgi:hypothetical protein